MLASFVRETEVKVKPPLTREGDMSGAMSTQLAAQGLSEGSQPMALYGYPPEQDEIRLTADAAQEISPQISSFKDRRQMIELEMTAKCKAVAEHYIKYHYERVSVGAATSRCKRCLE